MKAKETRIITASGVGALVIIIVLILLRYLRQRNSPAITANAVEVLTVTPTSSNTGGGGGSNYPIAPVTSSFVFYKPDAVQNAQTLIDDIPFDGIVFGKHYDIRVIAPPWDNYDGVSIQLNPVANDLIRIVIVNQTGETLDLPELTISALKLN